MDHFAGLDVSVKETSICIVDDTGRIEKEVKVASEPAALLKVLGNPIYRFKRIGLEAGPLSQWLFSALAEAELPVVCVETRHMQAVLKAQINKTDRNDARGIAQMIRNTQFKSSGQASLERALFDGEFHVDVVAGRVGIGAHLMGLGDQRLGPTPARPAIFSRS